MLSLSLVDPGLTRLDHRQTHLIVGWLQRGVVRPRGRRGGGEAEFGLYTRAQRPTARELPVRSPSGLLQTAKWKGTRDAPLAHTPGRLRQL